MTYKTVFIDWDGTLTNSRFWEGWKNDDRYAQVQNALFASAASKQITNSWMTGQATSEDITEYLDDVMDTAYEEILTELQRSAGTMTFINDDDLNKIQQLRDRGVNVVIATDNMDTFDRWTKPSLQLDAYFDDYLVSYNLGVLKTQREADGTSAFFHKYLVNNNVTAHESVLIDNSIDTKIVEQFGIDFMHVNSEQSLAYHLNSLLS